MVIKFKQDILSTILYIMPLPQQLMQFKSSDKEWHDKEPDMEDYANMPSPSFIVISGPTNCGKRSLCKNLIVLVYD